MKKTMIGLTGLATGLIGGAWLGGRINSGKGEVTNQKVDKFKGYYNLLNQWLSLKHQGINLEKYFTDNNYKTIAVYGMGELGNRLCDELKGTSVDIKYAIDKNAAAVYSDVNVVDVEDVADDVDVIVVTAVFAMEDIEKELEEYVSCPIVSLEDVVYEL